MTVMTSAGSTLSIATGAPATYDSTGFSALSFSAVGEITDLGAFGKAYNLVTYTAVGNRKMRKLKGSYNNGSMKMKLGFDQSDAGQVALRAALASDASYSFKVVLQDGTIEYFTGKVMDFTITVGTVDQITEADVTIEIDDDIVEA